MEKLSIPNELQRLTYLKPRIKFSPENELRLTQLEAGYIGETIFNKMLENQLSNHYFPLFDLLLKSDGNIFQSDCLIISNDTIYLYEVKNYQGNYYFQDDRWYRLRNQTEIRDPFLQLKKSDYLLKKLIQRHSSRFKIKSYLVFVNQSFHLYQAPINRQIIFPNQIKQHIHYLNNLIKDHHSANYQAQSKLVSWLKQQQMKKDFSNLPKYTLENLTTGIFCEHCLGKMTRHSQKVMYCRACEQYEDLEATLLKSINQFAILFPNKKIRTDRIYQWSGKSISRNTILRILKKNFKLINLGRHSYFEKHDESE